MQVLSTHSWCLPEWGYWSPEDYSREPELAANLREHQLGWDVTDFGSGDFSRTGLVLFALRNGRIGLPGERTYAEKLLLVEEGQETPAHLHRSKMEDIINRGGGTLVVEFSLADDRGNAQPGALTVAVDGRDTNLAQWESLELLPGQSVTIAAGIYHRFYAAPGRGVVLAGEVSQVNDDHTDNYFLKPAGRFADIVEDERATHPLWNEVGQ